LTNTALSGAGIYWETFGKIGWFNAKGVSIPVGVSVFPDELYPAPLSWARQSYPKLGRQVFWRKTLSLVGRRSMRIFSLLASRLAPNSRSVRMVK
jgi:hypothetical protein